MIYIFHFNLFSFISISLTILILLRDLFFNFQIIPDKSLAINNNYLNLYNLVIPSLLFLESQMNPHVMKGSTGFSALCFLSCLGVWHHV